MTKLTQALETLAEKSRFIATAKATKNTATAQFDAATDAAIMAAIEVGNACNGELPDKRVLKKRFPDAVNWDDVQANLLTYARLIMQGDGMTVTVGRGDDAIPYTVAQDTLTDAPGKLSTIATALRKQFDALETVYETAAIQMAINGDYESPEHARVMVESEKARATAGLPYSEDIVTEWESLVQEVGPDALKQADDHKAAKKVFDAAQALNNEAWAILADMMAQAGDTSEEETPIAQAA